MFAKSTLHSLSRPLSCKSNEQTSLTLKNYKAHENGTGAHREQGDRPHVSHRESTTRVIEIPEQLGCITHRQAVINSDLSRRNRRKPATHDPHRTKSLRKQTLYIIL